MYKRYKDVSLILKIVIGIVVGAVLGVLVPSWSFIDVLGKLFVFPNIARDRKTILALSLSFT